MIGLLLVTHADLGQALIHCAVHVHSKDPQAVRAYSVPADAPPETVIEDLLRIVAQLNDGSGVLVLADVCGATPCNVSTQLAALCNGGLRIVTGVNLPMVLRAMNYRHLSLADVTERALAGGRLGIMELPQADDCGCQESGAQDAAA